MGLRATATTGDMLSLTPTASSASSNSATTGRSRDVSGLGEALVALSVSPDGRFVAGVSLGKLQVWRVDGGRSVFPEPVPAHSPSQFSDDSSRILAVRADGSIGVWDLETGRQTRCVRTGIVPDTFAIHPDGRQLAVGYRERAELVQVWDIDSGKKLREQALGEEGSVCALAWHPDGNRLALGFLKPAGLIQIWDTAGRAGLFALESHAQWVWGMAFHPSGDLLVSGFGDGTSRLWDANTGRPLVNWSSGIGDMHFSRDGTVCGFAVLDRQARLMEVADGREYRTLISSLGAGKGEYREGDISADGLLAVGMDDGVRLWELATGRELAFLPDRRTDSVSFVSRGDGRELLTCGFGGLRRWPISADPQAPLKLRIGPPRDVKLPIVPTRAQVSQDGRTVAVAGEQAGTAIVMDLATESVRCTLTPHASMIRAVLSHDGRWAATSGWHSTSVKIWDARTGAMVKELPLGVNNNAFFSPDSRTLVTSRGDEYRFWEVGSWLPVRRLPWEVQSYSGWVAFSPDGKLLALEQSPAVIHLVDAATGRTVAKLEDPRSERAQWLGFTPDGSRLVAIATFSRAIHVWDLAAIRRPLAAMGLDWDSPPCEPSSSVDARPILAVEPLLGDGTTGCGERSKRFASPSSRARQCARLQQLGLGLCDRARGPARHAPGGGAGREGGADQTGRSDDSQYARRGPLPCWAVPRSGRDAARESFGSEGEVSRNGPVFPGDEPPSAG